MADWITGYTSYSSLANLIKDKSATKYPKFHDQFTADPTYISTCYDGATVKFTNETDKKEILITFSDYDGSEEPAIGYKFVLENSKLVGYRTTKEYDKHENGKRPYEQIQTILASGSNQALTKLSDSETIEILGAMVKSENAGDGFASSVFPQLKPLLQKMLVSHFEASVDDYKNHAGDEIVIASHAKAFANAGIPKSFLGRDFNPLSNVTIAPESNADHASALMEIESQFQSLMPAVDAGYADKATIAKLRKDSIEKYIQKHVDDSTKQSEIKTMLNEFLANKANTKDLSDVLDGNEQNQLIIDIMNASLTTVGNETIVPAEKAKQIDALNRILQSQLKLNDTRIFVDGNKIFAVQIMPEASQYSVNAVEFTDTGVKILKNSKFQTAPTLSTLSIPDTVIEYVKIKSDALTAAQTNLDGLKQRVNLTQYDDLTASTEIAEAKKSRNDELLKVVADIVEAHKAFGDLGHLDKFILKEKLKESFDTYINAEDVEAAVAALAAVAGNDTGTRLTNLKNIWSSQIEAKLIDSKSEAPAAIDNVFIRQLAEIKSSGNLRSQEIIRDAMLQISRGADLSLRQKALLRQVFEGSRDYDVSKFETHFAAITSNDALDYDPSLKALIESINGKTLALTSNEFDSLYSSNSIPRNIYGKLDPGMKGILSPLDPATQKLLVMHLAQKSSIGMIPASEEKDLSSTVAREIIVPEKFDLKAFRERILKEPNFLEAIKSSLSLNGDPDQISRFETFFDTISKAHATDFDAINSSQANYQTKLKEVLNNYYSGASKMKAFQETTYQQEYGLNITTINNFVDNWTKNPSKIDPNLMKLLAMNKLISMSDYNKGSEHFLEILKQKNYADASGKINSDKVKNDLYREINVFLTNEYPDFVAHPEKYPGYEKSMPQVLRFMENILGADNIRRNSSPKKQAISEQEFYISFSEFLDFCSRAQQQQPAAPGPAAPGPSAIFIPAIKPELRTMLSNSKVLDILLEEDINKAWKA